MRKRLALLFLLVAQIVILGHGTFAHHHHRLNSDIVHDHHNGHEDDGQHNESSAPGFMDIVFSGFSHSGEQVTYTHSLKTEVSFTKDAPAPFATAPHRQSIPVEYNISYQQRTIPPDWCNAYRSVALDSHSLRGPPCFIVA